ncbi:hypothetical protein SLS64_013227 [Diaporthe eres]|uniref:Uncharacterized protein n=1 Tax=Diaporthe eres TaxID=83184 RepID=A0ABR1NSU9_DIAER
MLFSQTTIAFMAFLAQGLAAATPKLANANVNANLLDPLAKREVAVDVCNTTHSTCMATVGASNPSLCDTLVATCCDDARDTCANRPGVDTAICAAEHAVCYAYFSLPIPV